MKNKSLLLAIILGFISVSVWALPPGGLGPGAGQDPDNDAVPIDGGISLLIAAGAAIGGSKLLKKKKEQV